MLSEWIDVKIDKPNYSLLLYMYTYNIQLVNSPRTWNSEQKIIALAVDSGYGYIHLSQLLSMGYGLCNSVWWFMFSANEQWTDESLFFCSLASSLKRYSSVFVYVPAQGTNKKTNRNELWVSYCVCDIMKIKRWKDEPIIRYLNVLVSIVYCSNPKMSCITNRSTNVRQISSDAKIK